MTLKPSRMPLLTLLLSLLAWPAGRPASQPASQASNLEGRPSKKQFGKRFFLYCIEQGDFKKKKKGSRGEVWKAFSSRFSLPSRPAGQENPLIQARPAGRAGKLETAVVKISLANRAARPSNLEGRPPSKKKFGK